MTYFLTLLVALAPAPSESRDIPTREQLVDMFGVRGEGPCMQLSLAQAYTHMAREGLAGDTPGTVPEHRLLIPFALLEGIALSDRNEEFSSAYLEACVHLAQKCALTPKSQLCRGHSGHSWHQKRLASCEHRLTSPKTESQEYCPTALYRALTTRLSDKEREGVDIYCSQSIRALVEFERFLRQGKLSFAAETVAFSDLTPWDAAYSDERLRRMREKSAAGNDTTRGRCLAAVFGWLESGRDLGTWKDCPEVKLVRSLLASMNLCPEEATRTFEESSLLAENREGGLFLFLEVLRSHVKQEQRKPYLDALLKLDWGTNQCAATTRIALTLMARPRGTAPTELFQMSRVLLEAVERDCTQTAGIQARAHMFLVYLRALESLTAQGSTRPALSKLRKRLEDMQEASLDVYTEAERSWIRLTIATAGSMAGAVLNAKRERTLRRVTVNSPARFALWSASFVERNRLCRAHAASMYCLDAAVGPAENAVCLAWQARVHWLAGREKRARSTLDAAENLWPEVTGQRFLWTAHSAISPIQSRLRNRPNSIENLAFSPLFLLNLLPRLDFLETKN